MSNDNIRAKKELDTRNNLKLNLPILIKILVIKKNNRNRKYLIDRITCSFL